MREAIEQLDALMNRLVEADQTGSGIEPLRVATELGRIRQLMSEAPAVIRREGGEQHFRCEACGTIVHGAAPPARCPECGKDRFFAADIEQPNVESGAG
ncbi:MAG: rubredoxin-like domain-containing protein [Candidatus Limnocylindria bacterium]